MFDEYCRLCQLAARYRTEAHGVPPGPERDRLHQMADDALSEARCHSPGSGAPEAPTGQGTLPGVSQTAPRAAKNRRARWGTSA